MQYSTRIYWETAANEWEFAGAIVPTEWIGVDWGAKINGLLGSRMAPSEWFGTVSVDHGDGEIELFYRAIYVEDDDTRDQWERRVGQLVFVFGENEGAVRSTAARKIWEDVLQPFWLKHHTLPKDEFIEASRSSDVAARIDVAVPPEPEPKKPTPTPTPLRPRQPKSTKTTSPIPRWKLAALTLAWMLGSVALWGTYVSIYDLGMSCAEVEELVESESLAPAVESDPIAPTLDAVVDEAENSEEPSGDDTL